MEETTPASKVDYTYVLSSCYYGQCYQLFGFTQVLLTITLITLVLIDYIHDQHMKYVFVLYIEIVILLLFTIDIVLAIQVKGCQVLKEIFFYVDIIIYLALVTFFVIVYNNEGNELNEQIDIGLQLMRITFMAARFGFMIFLFIKNRKAQQDHMVEISLTPRINNELQTSSIIDHKNQTLNIDTNGGQNINASTQKASICNNIEDVNQECCDSPLSPDRRAYLGHNLKNLDSIQIFI